MKYWLCITNETNWEIIKSKNVWGVSDRHKDKINMVGKGDKLIFYVKPMKVGGIFETISKPFREEIPIFEGELYPNRVKIKPTLVPNQFLGFLPLVNKLRFIRQKKRWGGHLQGKAMKLISKEDFNLIWEKLELFCEPHERD
jgi:predicted RNA-binding protein